MTATPESAAGPLDRLPEPATAAGRREHRFFLGMAAAVALTAFAGFAPTYYLKGLFHGPALSPLLHTHGVFSTIWIALYFTQTSLVATGHTRVHRRLGPLVAAFAVLLLGVGFVTALDAARRGVTPPGGPPPLAFLAVPLGTLVAFLAFLGPGLYFRDRPRVHKRCLLLANISLLAPALARIGLQTGLPGPTLPLAGTIAFVAGCWVYDWSSHRRVHPAFLWGGILLVLSIPLRFLIGLTAAWHAVALWLLG